MSDYATQMIAKSRQAELLREADQARLAKLAGSARAERADGMPGHVPLARRLVAGVATLLR